MPPCSTGLTRKKGIRRHAAQVKSQFQRKFEVVLFDLGHTLFYFNGDWNTVMAAANQALVEQLLASGFRFNREQFNADLTARLDAYYVERETALYELSTETILRAILTDYGYPQPTAGALQTAIDAMYTVTQQYWQPEEDARPMLETLQAQGYRLGAVSNAKDARDVENILVRSGLRGFFEHVVISSTVGWRKPHPRIFTIVLDLFKVAPQCAVMIGDTLEADILGARNAGIASIWITRRSPAPGSHAPAQTALPDARIAALSELPALLSTWS